MAAYLCLLRNPFPWLAAFGSFLAFAYSSDFGYLSVILTSSVVLLYPMIVFFSKSFEQKSTFQEDFSSPQEQERDIKGSSGHEGSTQNAEKTFAEFKNEEEVKAVENSEKKEDKKDREVLLSSSETTLSDSESFDHTTSSEDSENDWIFRENLSQSTQFSDGSISDEESLIEIALPEGNYVESSKNQEKKQQPFYGFQQKWPDCSIESHLRQPNWMEILMEEENLIEIDICMGCIKCSRFEIEA